MAKLIDIGPGPVNETERRVVELLTNGLPGSYRVVPNVTITERPSGQALEYDAIVLTGHAVYAVEVKGWRGTIRAINRRDWQLDSGHYATNPLPLIDFKAKVLKSHLEHLDLVAPGGRRLRAPFVLGCFVCGTDDTLLEVFPGDAPRCLRPGELCAFIDDPLQLPVAAERDQYKPVLGRLTDFIKGKLQGRPAAPRRFAAYRVTTTVAQREDSAEYLAKHAEFDDGRIYRVRTWWVSPYRFDEAERQRRLKVLRRSAEALNRIGTHPNVVSLHAFDTEADCIYEVTDWSTAGTLATALSLGSPRKWPIERKLSLLRGLARALAVAQDKEIFHRDLRPSAVLLGPDGQPKVGDFDLAFMMSADETVYGDAALKAIGDHHYRPPELRETATADVFESTDLYSLGRIAFDVFAGRQPGAPPGEDLPLLSSQCEPGEIPKAIVEELDVLVASMVQHDPAARPKDPAEVVDLLGQMLDRLAQPPAEAAEPPIEDEPEGVDPVAERQARGEYLPGERIDGSNVVLEVLGRGAGATVYLVQNEVLQDELALKLVHGPGDRDGPLRELKLLMRLDHPHLVKAYWAGTIEGSDEKARPTYLLMEHLEGGTLAERLEQGTLPVEEAMAIVTALADALAALHGAAPPLVHRDLKPENIHLTARGPVLADLGTAATVDEAGAAPVGSLRYTPPDLPEVGWGPDADVFALGTVAWQMLTGRAPWGSGAPSVDHPPERLELDELPTAVADVLQLAVSARRQDRFADADQFLDALERAAAAERPAPTAPEDRSNGEASKVSVPPPEPPASPWTLGLVSALGEAASVTQRLASALRRGRPGGAGGSEVTSFLEAEARAAALEEPLVELLPSLYDELLEPSGAWPLLADPEAAEDDEPEPRIMTLTSADGVLVLDGLSNQEVGLILPAVAHEAGGTLDEWVWRAGAIDPALPAEGAEALGHIFGAPPEALREVASLDELAGLSTERRRRLRWRLPAGRRDDDLGALLAERAEAIAGAVGAALGALSAEGAVLWVTTTFGAIYLGHGLRRDVGGGAGGRADQVRAAWRAACPDGRAGRLPSGSALELEGPASRPSRQHKGRVFPVGRLAWPDSPEAPRLASGGLGLGERLLPLVRVGRP